MIENHYPGRWGVCGGGLERERSVFYAARQVFDLPPPPLEVVEHRAHACACAPCGETSRAGFPEGVNAPVQYGSRISSPVLFFNGLQMLPHKRLAEMMATFSRRRYRRARSRRSCAGAARRGRRSPTGCGTRLRGSRGG
ncbi:MAG: IS66 family transposase zinc-finger binding domain-containing protein [Gammaproteobacteria bacterium]|nr:IS66 family transposase zinc-finger binding domain-containing protein [Gammaproteobacteria bacterium]